jgi:16S rRNA processing protein RimM
LSYLVIAKIGKPVGLKGELKLQSFSAPQDNILDYHPLYFKKNDSYQEISNFHIRPRGDTFVIHVEPYNTPETASVLTNQEIYIHHNQLPALPIGEFYWHDLIGIKVYNMEKYLLGIIDSIQDTGANPVLFVKSDEKTRLVPYVFEEIVKEVNLLQQQMIVDWDADF